LSEESSAKSGLVRHQVAVELRGVSQDLLNFVDNLDMYLPIVTISDLSISQASKLTKVSETKLDLDLVYYHYQFGQTTPTTLEKSLLTESDYQILRSLTDYKTVGFSSEGMLYSGSEKEELFN
jgi:Tfp pilus assembly protein PilO